MKFDTKDLEHGSLIEGDVALVGGGIVGLALGNQLADAGLDVVILESGREEPDEKTQALYEGRFSIGGPNLERQQDGYLSASRFRTWGGSGNQWGGVSLPLDEADFESRDWVPHSGWPITLRELKPYYNRACDLLDLAHFFGPEGEPRHQAPLGLDGGARLISRPQQLTRYTGHVENGPWQRWKSDTLARERLRTYLGANVTHVSLAADGQKVEELKLQTLEGGEHTVRAKVYVLATGGIENVRLMLASNDVASSGIGNHSDWLGRCFQGHAVVFNAFSQMLPLTPGPDWRDYAGRSRERVSWVIGSSLPAQAEARTGNFSVYVRPIRMQQKNAEAIHQVALRLAAAEAPQTRILRAMYGIEHTPHRDSRIELLPDEPDPLGMPRVRVRWLHPQHDLDGFERAVAQVGTALGRHDVARLRWSNLQSQADKFVQVGARHHMGATRMSPDPKLGVVDTMGRVHGVGNLYVGGSSIFPTSGLANPTLTILALTLRQGDHLASRVGAAA